VGVFGGAGTEIRNAAVTGNGEFNHFNIRIAKSCFPLCCCFTSVIAPWANVFSKQDTRLSPCVRGWDERNGFPLQTTKPLLTPAAGHSSRQKGGCGRPGTHRLSQPPPWQAPAAARPTKHLSDDPPSDDSVRFTRNLRKQSPSRLLPSGGYR